MSRAGLCIAVAIWALGCSPADVECRITTDYEQQPLSTEQLSGALELASGETKALFFELSIERLSDFGFEQVDNDLSQFRVSYSLSYGPSEPAGAQLPAVTFTKFLWVNGTRVSPDSKWGVGPDVFSCTAANEEPCCPKDAASCQVQFGVEFSRSDMLFPPVIVDWNSSTHVVPVQCTNVPQFTAALKEFTP